MSAPKTAVEITPRFRINCGRQFAFGPGKAELMARIDETGSIAEAAKRMGMSYMRAWKIVKSLEQCQPEPLIQITRGGRQRGGATLTPTGRKVLELYQELDATSRSATRAISAKLTRLLLP